MTNGQANKAFLESVGTLASSSILHEIAKHYGSTKDAIFSEVTHDDAEFLFEYMTSSNRMRVFNLMKKMNLA
jgi:hypothetical protein